MHPFTDKSERSIHDDSSSGAEFETTGNKARSSPPLSLVTLVAVPLSTSSPSSDSAVKTSTQNEVNHAEEKTPDQLEERDDGTSNLPMVNDTSITLQEAAEDLGADITGKCGSLELAYEDLLAGTYLDQSLQVISRCFQLPAKEEEKLDLPASAPVDEQVTPESATPIAGLEDVATKDPQDVAEPAAVADSFPETEKPDDDAQEDKSQRATMMMLERIWNENGENGHRFIGQTGGPAEEDMVEVEWDGQPGMMRHSQSASSSRKLQQIARRVWPQRLTSSSSSTSRTRRRSVEVTPVKTTAVVTTYAPVIMESIPELSPKVSSSPHPEAAPESASATLPDTAAVERTKSFRFLRSAGSLRPKIMTAVALRRSTQSHPIQKQSEHTEGQAHAHVTKEIPTVGPAEPIGALYRSPSLFRRRSLRVSRPSSAAPNSESTGIEAAVIPRNRPPMVPLKRTLSTPVWRRTKGTGNSQNAVEYVPESEKMVPLADGQVHVIQVRRIKSGI